MTGMIACCQSWRRRRSTGAKRNDNISSVLHPSNVEYMHYMVRRLQRAATDLTSPHGHVLSTNVVASRWYLGDKHDARQPDTMRPRHHGSSIGTHAFCFNHTYKATCKYSQHLKHLSRSNVSCIAQVAPDCSVEDVVLQFDQLPA